MCTMLSESPASSTGMFKLRTLGSDLHSAGTQPLLMRAAFLPSEATIGVMRVYLRMNNAQNMIQAWLSVLYGTKQARDEKIW